MKVLVTGAAGFIGMHTSKRLLDEGYEVVGLDNMNNYYDPKLKEYRLNQLVPYEKFRFIKKISISEIGSCVDELSVAAGSVKTWPEHSGHWRVKREHTQHCADTARYLHYLHYLHHLRYLRYLLAMSGRMSCYPFGLTIKCSCDSRGRPLQCLPVTRN